MAAYRRHYYSKKGEYIVTKPIQRREGWSCSLGPGLEHKTYSSVVSITTAFLCNLARMLQIWGIGLVPFYGSQHIWFLKINSSALLLLQKWYETGKSRELCKVPAVITIQGLTSNFRMKKCWGKKNSDTMTFFPFSLMMENKTNILNLESKDY